jgi:segregation and condensation protein B
MSGEEGLSMEQLRTALPEQSEAEISDALAKLKEIYAQPSRGIELVEYASRIKFVSKESVYPFAKKLFEQYKSVGLSPASMETLAIIAYKQPITRAEIEEIRGVSSDSILKKLTARNLIEAKDRLDAAGKPLLYTVTDTFLDAFELESLSQLPQLAEPKTEQDLFENR